jgi:hypothetical protein
MVQELKDETSESQNTINSNILTGRWEYLVLPSLTLNLESPAISAFVDR